MIAQLWMLGFWLLEEQVSFDLQNLWHNMAFTARFVVVLLFLMSSWSLGIMIDRVLMYNAARKQSRVFVQQVAGALREGKLDEAISIAERNKKSHIAKVVATGLNEFQTASTTVSEQELIEAAKRGLERSIAIVHAEMKRGLSAVAGGISEALVTTALGLLVAIPAVWAYNIFTNKVESFDVEMDNSSMELINYFVTRRGAARK